MEKPDYLGFAILQVSKLLIYETFCYKLQPYFGWEKLQSHYMLCDSFVLSIITQIIINDLKNYEDLFDFVI